MKWNNLKISAKLGLGFGSLIVIMLALGVLAVVNMQGIKKESTDLASEYVPEVRYATDLLDHTREMMYDMRGYAFTEEEAFYTQAMQKVKEVKASIGELQDLNTRAKRLVKLNEQISVVVESFNQYEQLISNTVEKNKMLNEARVSMDAAAAKYMNNCNTYLQSQNDQMTAEINGGGTNIQRLTKITLINNIIDEGNATRVANFKAQATHDPELLSQAIKQFKSSFSLFDEVRAITNLQADLDALQNVQDAANAYEVAMSSFLKNWQEQEEISTNRTKVGSNLVEACVIMNDAGIDGTTKISDDNVSAASTSSNVIIIGFTFAIIIGLVFSVIITRGIVTGLKKGVEISKTIADGDLTIKVEDSYLSRKDEIGSLSLAMNRMVEKLRSIVADVVSGADNIAAASVELSSTSQEMSQGTTEQASSAEEVSSSMEEMASNIQQNTDNAQQTEKIALKAAEDVREGSKAVTQTVDSMRTIAEKITIIGEIARQTNILALNAAVEAARAGEHGKGFAVVAAEVRKLAERSQMSANEIDELSKSSVGVAEKSGKLLQEIVPDIEKTAKLVQEIAAASIEQNSGADQVNNAIQQLNQVIQQNAAASEEMATSSEELASQADQMKEIIAFFKVDQHKRKKSTSLMASDNKKSNVNKPKLNPAHQNQQPAKKATLNKKTHQNNELKEGGFNIDMGQKDDKDDEYEKF